MWSICLAKAKLGLRNSFRVVGNLGGFINYYLHLSRNTYGLIYATLPQHQFPLANGEPDLLYLPSPV